MLDGRKESVRFHGTYAGVPRTKLRVFRLSSALKTVVNGASGLSVDAYTELETKRVAIPDIQVPFLSSLRKNSYLCSSIVPLMNSNLGGGSGKRQALHQFA
ncbi:hypothetical protein CBL_07961 [Carabus blaptoides fortunei]